MSDVSSQKEVYEYYKENSREAATVGDYIRVRTGNSKKTCFGPLPSEPQHNWKVVEIDWVSGEFLLAPIGERSIEQ